MADHTIAHVGSRALLFQPACPFDLHSQQRIWALADEAVHWPGVSEAVPGITNLTLLFESVPTDAEQVLRDLVRLWNTGRRQERDGRLIELPIIYGGKGGPHLHEVADLTGLTIDEVIRRHTAPEYTVFAIGSHAGYGYLGGLDPRLETPRREVPLPRLPGGSLSMAGLQTGISASSGPSGWNTVGTAEVSFFDPFRQPAAMLAPGDRIRLVAAEVIA